ncbi:hypothetical protein SLITO_v1c06120 [Spiroplasma litorale]|uniref:Abortive phage infection protein C-terminal domain-containing protein n=1 Tax=Spiroplasma litorale TaxID=216942 RepID=A0A0K1W238_9MOLU|nr:AIPR family protein [Spiroplasma litorale]AKX34246.1 hypothetical protein SLITO_v1c06120 [Spiroplasma litorale]
MKNKLEEYIEVALKSRYSNSTNLIIMCHFIFSREKDLPNAIYDYDNSICYSNNSKCPKLIIYDEAEDFKKPILFFMIKEEDELDDTIKNIIIFIDNLKKGLFPDNLRPNYKDLLENICRNDAYNFDINIIINNYISDNEIKDLYKKLSIYSDIDNYGDFNFYDRKKLNNKLEGEEDENLTDGNLVYNFTFVNQNNAETKLTNTFSYETKNEKILLCTLEATSLVNCYQKFENRIFDRNIRYSISGDAASKSVDQSIKMTVNEEPEKFIIYNNGITIVAENIGDLDINNNLVKLTNFSIVNGAQTVTNLAKFYKSNELKDNINKVKVIAKIVQSKNNDYNLLVEKITKSSNNQKPVKPRDFRSNSIEMRSLRDFFEKNGFVLNVKRGESNYKVIKNISENLNIKKPLVLENDVLAQYVLSTIFLKPYEANQKKSKIFSDELYNKIFKNDKLKEEYYLNVFKFYTDASKLIKKINNYINFGDIPIVQTLIKSIENWLISTLWLIYNYKDEFAYLTSIDSADEILNNKLIYNESIFLSYKGFDETGLTDFVKASYDEIYELYTKNLDKSNKPYSASAFSFKKDLYSRFIYKLVTPSVFTDTKKQQKIEFLENLFIRD